MTEHDLLAARFEGHRARLRAVAYRMLGSTGEADDAVQAAWLRLSRSGSGGILMQMMPDSGQPKDLSTRVRGRMVLRGSPHARGLLGGQAPVGP